MNSIVTDFCSIGAAGVWTDNGACLAKVATANVKATSVAAAKPSITPVDKTRSSASAAAHKAQSAAAPKAASATSPKATSAPESANETKARREASRLFRM
jgi:hypothetical protein